MQSSESEEAIVLFTTVTNLPEEVAIQFLEQSDWNVERAIETYFASGAGEEPAVVEGEGVDRSPAVPSESSSSDSSTMVPRSRSRSVGPAPAAGWSFWGLIAAILNRTRSFLAAWFPFIGPFLGRFFGPINGPHTLSAANASGALVGPDDPAAAAAAADFKSRFHAEFLSSLPGQEQSGGPRISFLPISFRAAVYEAARANRLLFVTLHSFSHDQCDAFARQVLCDVRVGQALAGTAADPSTGYVVWGGDVARPEGQRVARLLRVAVHPYCCILRPDRSGHLIVCATLEGGAAANMDPSTLSVQLTSLARSARPSVEQALASHATRSTASRSAASAAAATAAAAESAAAATIRSEQERAFQASVERDQARIRAQREREQEEIRQREAEMLAEDRKAEELAVKLSRVPPPPASGGVLVKVRLQSGQTISRRFDGSGTMINLFDWVETSGSEAPESGAYVLVDSLRKQYVDDNFPLSNFGSGVLLIVEAT